MREIGFSLMLHEKDLGLDAYAASSFVRVRCEELWWPTAWNRIVQIGIYQKGPDISEVGTTWLENLDEMNALRPFRAKEVESFGGKGTFAPSIWIESPKNGVVSIPWLVDTRYLVYRRDLLAKAGIDEATAFRTAEEMTETMRRLKAAIPDDCGTFSMNTMGLSFHNMVNWVWGRGGDFRSEDGHKITLMEPKARRGLLDYFGLREFFHPALKTNPPANFEDLFFKGQAAVMMAGNWLINNFRNPDFLMSRVVRENLGFALPPGGIPYLGGSHLVIWRHSLHEDEDLALIRYLTGKECMKRLVDQNLAFPARVELYEQPPISNDPLFQVFCQSVRQGKALHSSYRWAAVEMRLNDFINHLWADLFADPQLDLEKELDSRLRSLSDKLEKTLLASW